MREKATGATIKDVLFVSQEQVQKQSSKNEEEHAPEESKDIRNQELTDDVDEMLADIDEALGDLTEDEVQTFVDEYQQKGGEAVVCPERERGSVLNALKKWWRNVVEVPTFQPVVAR